MDRSGMLKRVISAGATSGYPIKGLVVAIGAEDVRGYRDGDNQDLLQRTIEETELNLRNK